MFQQTIQDILALAEAGPGTEALLACVRSRIGAFEHFDSGELLVQTEQGLAHFVLAPGLGEIGKNAVAAMGEGSTRRFDTAAELQERGLARGTGLASLLILRLEAPGVPAAAIVLGSVRAWSFAAAPLSRIRTIASVALRLLVRHREPGQASEETGRLMAEVARLRTHVSTLEAEIVILRTDRARKRSGKPQ